jgi:hypothetical protein
MPASPRCAASLRNGSPCGRTVVAGSEFCVHHTKLLETVDAETMRKGKTPKPSARKASSLRLVSEAPLEYADIPIAPLSTADPASVRPLLAAAAAENVEQLKTSLLEAAGSAAKPVWITVECTGCGERSRIEAPIPDVRARVAAIELLLREGLGRPAVAEESPTTRLPTTVDAVKSMSWEQMQTVFAAIYAEEIAAVADNGGDALVRERVSELGPEGRRLLRDALAAV